MSRAVVVVLALCSSAYAQSYPSSPDSAITAKAGRVSLTPDGPWLATPVAAKTYLSIYEDISPRPRFGEWASGARLLFYVERDALHDVVQTRAFVQPSEASVPTKDVYASVGYQATTGTKLELTAPEKNGFVEVRIVTDDAVITGVVPAASIGKTFRFSPGGNDRPAWKPTMQLPKRFALLDKAKGTAFVTVDASSAQPVMVLRRAAGFALVRIANGAVGWIAAKQLATLKPSTDGEEGGEEGGVAGGVVGGTTPSLPYNTPLFDGIDGAFVGVASGFAATPAETKGTWQRYVLPTPYGSVSVWASSTKRAAPPPKAPQNIPPTMLEAHRTSGTKQIVPDDATKQAIVAAGKDKVIGSFKLCIDETGTISALVKLKSTGFPAYDAKLMSGMREWKYQPYEIDGVATPVCTAITFIYQTK